MNQNHDTVTDTVGGRTLRTKRWNGTEAERNVSKADLTGNITANTATRYRQWIYGRELERLITLLQLQFNIALYTLARFEFSRRAANRRRTSGNPIGRNRVRGR